MELKPFLYYRIVRVKLDLNSMRITDKFFFPWTTRTVIKKDSISDFVNNFDPIPIVLHFKNIKVKTKDIISPNPDIPN